MLLSLDDCLYSLQETIPHLNRASLHRCLQWHDLSRLPEETSSPEKKKFKSSPVGYFHVNIAKEQTEEGRLYLFATIDRTSKFSYAQLYTEATRTTAKFFFKSLVDAVSYKIYTILTNNSTQFTNRKQDVLAFMTLFDGVCLKYRIEHRLTRVKHP